MFNLKGPQGQNPRTTVVRGPQFEKRCSTCFGRLCAHHQEK